MNLRPKRNSGNWLPGVERCPQRVEPCGNPWCADEAMRAAEIEAGGKDNLIARLQAEHAREHAQKIAARCEVSNKKCPLEVFTGKSRGGALKDIEESY